MGMFDRVWAPCPKCATDVEFQSKGGDPCLRDWTPDTAPAAVIADILGDEHECPNCGHVLIARLESRPRVTFL